jgi:hypothetical protein
MSNEGYVEQFKIVGARDLQHWMERSMNIINGYLENIGYEQEWDQISDEN